MGEGCHMSLDKQQPSGDTPGCRWGRIAVLGWGCEMSSCRWGAALYFGQVRRGGQLKSSSEFWADELKQSKCGAALCFKHVKC